MNQSFPLTTLHTTQELQKMQDSESPIPHHMSEANAAVISLKLALKMIPFREVRYFHNYTPCLVSMESEISVRIIAILILQPLQHIQDWVMVVKFWCQCSLISTHQVTACLQDWDSSAFTRKEWAWNHQLLPGRRPWAWHINLQTE